jgi:transposase-like protein
MAILKLDKVKLDGGTQFRESIIQDKVNEYKQLMFDDVVFKPVDVVFDGEHYYLVDGFHRYFAIKAMDATTIEANVTEGTIEDAIRRARRANSTHGMPRTNETKRRVVMSALNDPTNVNAVSREIASECQVSHTLVLNIIKSLKVGINSKETEKPTKDLGINSKETESSADPKPSMTQDFSPSEEELEANQKAIEADIQAMNKLLEASEPLAVAHAEIKKLNLDYANLESRFNALMREKDKAVELLQKTQRELDKVKKAKK